MVKILHGEYQRTACLTAFGGYLVSEDLDVDAVRKISGLEESESGTIELQIDNLQQKRHDTDNGISLVVSVNLSALFAHKLMQIIYLGVYSIVKGYL